MRAGRLAAAATMFSLAAGLTIAQSAGTGVPAAAARRAAAGRPAGPSDSAGPAVLIRPDVIRAARALEVPPSTAFCEQHFRIACYVPGQIQQAYGLPSLYPQGITGAGQTCRTSR
jgi:hypothetical protein